MNGRLTKSDWIRHGLQTLAKSGPGALKVGAMAAGLNVSRGSFYWHFRDIDDFRAQMFDAWRTRTIDRAIAETAAMPAPQRLQHLLRQAFVGQRDFDRALRAWASQDEELAAVVAAVDKARIRYMSDLIAVAGVPREPAAARARFIYWAYLGQAMLRDPDETRIDAAGIDDVSRVFEA